MAGLWLFSFPGLGSLRSWIEGFRFMAFLVGGGGGFGVPITVPIWCETGPRILLSSPSLENDLHRHLLGIVLGQVLHLEIQALPQTQLPGKACSTRKNCYAFEFLQRMAFASRALPAQTRSSAHRFSVCPRHLRHFETKEAVSPAPLEEGQSPSCASWRAGTAKWQENVKTAIAATATTSTARVTGVSFLFCCC